MKKIGMLICAVVAVSLLISQPSVAANSNNNGNGNTSAGNPFDELRELISENRSLIEANQGEIADLKEKTDAINLRIDLVESNLAEVAQQVAGNSADITAAFEMIASAGDDIEALRTGLSELAAHHQADISAIEDVLALIQIQIDNLVTQSTALATELNNRVAELRSLISDNAVGIDALVLDITLLNAQVGTINSALLALDHQQANLTGQVATQSQQLANLSVALDLLKNRVNSLHDPCSEFITLGGVVNGELVNDGECTSVSRGNGNYAARYYTFTISSQTEITIEMDGMGSNWSQNCPDLGTLYDTYLYLHAGGRDGSVISSNDDSYRDCAQRYTYNSRIVQTLEPGTYTIESTSFGSSQFGTFQLSVR